MKYPSSHFPQRQPGAVFAALTPERVLEMVESILHTSASTYGRMLPSYINRVYDIPLEDGRNVIVKFYRPGRWTPEALQDEHTFLLEMAEDEIPVIAPLPAVDNGATLHFCDGYTFALFPKEGGRACDEPSPDEWMQIGRLLARVHQVGARHPAEHRLTLHPAHSARFHLETILERSTLAGALRERYQSTVLALLDGVEPLFDDVENIRLHGDMHCMNLIWRPDEPLRIIDFDDMMNGPVIQDFWMLLPGRLNDSRREWDLLLRGYELFAGFDKYQTCLIEPLRALRYLHHTAWCVLQQSDGIHARLEADFGTPEYWQREIRDLQAQHEIIQATTP